MKKTVLVFALPLLLALSPTAASAARILWISIDEEATILDPSDDQVKPIYSFQPSGKVLNAAKVSVEGKNGSSSTYLLFAYEGENGLVVDDPDSDTVEVSLPSGSGSGSGSESGSGSGSGSGTGTTSEWLSVHLSDLYDKGKGSDDLTVTLELGHVDWDAVEAAYNNDPTTVAIQFERMAIAMKTISELDEAGYLSDVASLAPPGQTPWTPSTYSAVPEPSVCCTALLGVFLLTKRRKTGRQRG